MQKRLAIVCLLIGFGSFACLYSESEQQSVRTPHATFRNVEVAPADVAQKGPAATTEKELDLSNPVLPLPEMPLGHDQKLADLPNPPVPERVRLGRWLFFDKRLSADRTVACASCHKSVSGFSDPAKVATGIRGQKGKRKAPSFINVAFAFFPEQFWDGRAATLEEQAKGPMNNPVEMGSTHDVVVRAIRSIAGYSPFFNRAFGDSNVTLDRITSAISDYERTRISGNSPWDRWRRSGDESAVTSEVKLGDKLFFGKAKCSKCHIATVLTDPRYADVRGNRKTGKEMLLVGNSFTDWRFHNIGIGWDPVKKDFADKGRGEITGQKTDIGAFKTPGLRDTASHPPYMHDGSIATLEAVIEHYRKGGIENPYLDTVMEPLDLTEADSKALVAFLKSLSGEGYQDAGPTVFPQ